MPQQNPFGSANEKYRKKLFVDNGFSYMEVGARIVEPYTPPTKQPRVTELQIINAPSHLQHMGFGSYECSMTLLFQDKQSYAEYVSLCGFTHKFYDEKGSMYLGALEAIKPKAVQASTKYMVEISLKLIRKDSYDRDDRFKYQDIDGHWAEDEISAMANLGLISVITRDGSPVLYFRPNDFMTRAEFITMINRTRRFVERLVRE